jgi:hypothetical protein
MSEDIFVDGIRKGQLLGGAVRLELFAFLPDPPGAVGMHPATPRLRLVMAPETLAHLHAATRDLVDQLLARGLVRAAELDTKEVSDGNS